MDKPEPPRYLDDDEAYFVEYPGYIRLYLDLKQYRIDNNPIWLYRIFEICHDNNIYPPAVVMEWLAKGILHPKPNDIPKRLSLTVKRGNESLFSAFERKQKIYRIMMEIFILNSGARIPVAAAAEGVCLRMERDKKEIHNASWLEDQYRRRWKKYFSARNDLQSLVCLVDTPDKLTRYLERYPADWRRRYVLK